MRFKLLKEIYRKDVMSRTQIFESLKVFEDGPKTDDLPVRGQIKTSLVNQLKRSNHRLTKQMLSGELSLNIESADGGGGGGGKGDKWDHVFSMRPFRHRPFRRHLFRCRSFSAQIVTSSVWCSLTVQLFRVTQKAPNWRRKVVDPDKS